MNEKNVEYSQTESRSFKLKLDLSVETFKCEQTRQIIIIIPFISFN